MKIMNDDGIYLHNIHTYSTVNPSFRTRRSQKFKKRMMDKVIEEATEVIKGHLRCAWLDARMVGIDRDPSMTRVTDDKGNYSIANVPPGSYIMLRGMAGEARQVG